MPQATLTFYNITQFGYYKKSVDAPVFGDLEGILEELAGWASRLNRLDATRMNGVDKRGCFLVDALRIGSAGEFLLVFWNESHNNDGVVPSIFLNSTKGNPLIAENEVEEGSVPGFPTYFLVLPDRMKLVAVRFEGDSSCMPNVAMYIQGFMKIFSRHAVRTDVADGEMQILGYKIDPADANEQPQKLYPRVGVKLVPKPSAVQEIFARHLDIKAVIRQETLNTLILEDRSRINKVLSWLRNGAVGPSVISDSLKTVVEIDYTPNRDELAALIDEFIQSEDLDTFDLGFKLKGEQNVKWLGRGGLQQKFDLDVVRSNGMAPIEPLAEALHNVRRQVLALIDG